MFLHNPVSLWIHEHAEQVCMFLCLKNLPDAQACLFGLCLHVIVVAVLQLSVTVTPPPPVSSQVETLFIQTRLFMLTKDSCKSFWLGVSVHSCTFFCRQICVIQGWKSFEGEEKSEIKLRTHKEYPHLLPERNRDWLTLKVFTHPHVLSNCMTLCSYFQIFRYMI